MTEENKRHEDINFNTDLSEMYKEIVYTKKKYNRKEELNGTLEQ